MIDLVQEMNDNIRICVFDSEPPRLMVQGVRIGTATTPTFADLYDRANGNEPIVGVAGTVDIHFGMMSHGAFWNGGDRDVALTRTRGGGSFTLGDEGSVWNLDAAYTPFYELAGYANDVPGFGQDKAALDRLDGAFDGRWGDDDIDQLLFGFNTPARSPYQERVIEEVVARERFGRDRVTDLLLLARAQPAFGPGRLRGAACRLPGAAPRVSRSGHAA